MSTPPHTPTPPLPHGGPPPGTIACPRCGSAIGPEQDWCVTCGVAARTRVAPVPNWKRPILVVGAVGALALATSAVALVSLSATDAPPGNATVTAVVGPPLSTAAPAAPAVPPAAGAATPPVSTIGTPTTISPGAATTPPATTPAATTPAATTPTTPTGGVAPPP